MTGRDTQDDAARVLVVDDDAALAEMVQIVLQREGYVTYWCDNGADALDSCTGFNPDLILLDLMLPGRNGIEVCRDIRRTSGVPIIMLTARSETADVVSGLESGADDYVSKPFKTKELVARVRARLRQPNDLATPDVIALGGLVIDTAAHRVTRDGAEIMLTP
ncbi:MAG: response regulator, partial [Cutibacterium granulosum]|nr:response regulator [Cutibacterium granulosum]